MLEWNMNAGEDIEVIKSALQKTIFELLQEPVGASFKDIVVNPLDYRVLLDAVRKACESQIDHQSIDDLASRLTFEVLPLSEKDRRERQCHIIVTGPREVVEQIDFGHQRLMGLGTPMYIQSTTQEVSPMSLRAKKHVPTITPDVKAATRLALENAALWVEEEALDTDLFGKVNPRQTEAERAALREARFCAVNYLRLGARR